MVMDCIFCKIIAGQIPCDRVYHDEQVLAFLDIAPITRGHTLVVSKQHFPDVAAAPSAVVDAMMAAIKKIAPGVLETTGATAFNVGINNGTAAGQVVRHVHFHLIPRRADDGLRSWPHQTYGPGEGAALARQIAASVA